MLSLLYLSNLNPNLPASNCLKNIAMKYASWVYKNQYDYPKNQFFVGINLTTSLKLHTTVYLCEHAGKPPPKKKEDITQKTKKQKRQRKNSSIKIGCTASIYKNYLANHI